MIEREYLERLLNEMVAQLREHEGNASAARGGIQVVQHLLDKIVGEAIASPTPTNAVEGKSDDGIADI